MSEIDLEDRLSPFLGRRIDLLMSTYMGGVDQFEGYLERVNDSYGLTVGSDRWVLQLDAIDRVKVANVEVDGVEFKGVEFDGPGVIRADNTHNTRTWAWIRMYADEQVAA